MVAIDYCVFTDNAEEGVTDTENERQYATILVAKDKSTKMIFADVVHQKGVDPYAVKVLVEHILFLGHAEIRLRSDGDSPIKALLTEVAVELTKAGVRVVPDLTPKGDSQAGGLQEAAVKVVKEKVRCIWHQACELHGTAPGSHHPMLPWCVQYAAQLLNRTVVGTDGKTAWRRVTGRVAFPRPLMPWGEMVHFIEGGGKMKPGSAAPKWSEGIFLALVDKSSEYVIGTPMGCVKSSNAKRRDDASDKELFKVIIGFPWKMSAILQAGSSQDELPVRAVAVKASAVPERELPPRLSAPRASGPRNVYIRTEVESARYGYTEFCPGCTASFLREKAKPHSEECRRRIKAA